MTDYKAIAQFLGEPNYNYCPRPYKNAPYGDYITSYGSGPVRDEILIVGVLEKLAEDNKAPSLLWDYDIRKWEAMAHWNDDDRKVFRTAPTAIEAISSLVTALQGE